MGNKGKLPMVAIIIVAAVLLLAGMGIVGKVVLSDKSEGDAKKSHAKTTEMALGEFVVNLADAGELRYIKADIVLEVCGHIETGGHGGHGGGGPNSRVRDAVITVLSGKRFAELCKPGGKEALKEDIKKAINERLEDAEVVHVYFNDFAMQ